ncbi:hypothetical protein WA158_007513 [Blastocystis sp. Blastoise]
MKNQQEIFDTSLKSISKTRLFPQETFTFYMNDYIVKEEYRSCMMKINKTYSGSSTITKSDILETISFTTDSECPSFSNMIFQKESNLQIVSGEFCICHSLHFYAYNDVKENLEDTQINRSSSMNPLFCSFCSSFTFDLNIPRRVPIYTIPKAIMNLNNTFEQIQKYTKRYPFIEKSDINDNNTYVHNVTLSSSFYILILSFMGLIIGIYVYKRDLYIDNTMKTNSYDYYYFSKNLCSHYDVYMKNEEDNKVIKQYLIKYMMNSGDYLIISN